MDFEILEDGTNIYIKTLDQFKIENAGTNGILLFTFNPGTTKTINLKVTFKESADNDFQNLSVVFDLVIGIAFDIPQECQHIVFTQPPIFGTDNNDNLRGTNKNDLIIAFDGNDQVDASNGDDCVIGGNGKDKLDGSNGNDVLFGGDGDDEIDASNGNDKIVGGEGSDVLNGKNGDDYIEGGGGNDKLSGGNGNDTLLGENGNDSAKGDLGIDRCQAETKSNCEL